MDKQKERVLEQFDSQIRKEYRAANGDRERCPSYWQKMLFVESLKLNQYDWKQIRSGDYWYRRDSLRGMQRSKFMLGRIRTYLHQRQG